MNEKEAIMMVRIIEERANGEFIEYERPDLSMTIAQAEKEIELSKDSANVLKVWIIMDPFDFLKARYIKPNMYRDNVNEPFTIEE